MATLSRTSTMPVINLNPVTSASNVKTTAQQQLAQAIVLNKKLQKLFEVLKQSTREGSSKVKVTQDTGADTDALRKKQKKLETQIEHEVYLLNSLISENCKLKTAVNNSRNSRVIYSNVYKNLQKEIRRQEDLYKMTILDNMAQKEAYHKIEERFAKNIAKVTEDNQGLEQQLSEQTTQQYLCDFIPDEPTRSDKRQAISASEIERKNKSHRRKQIVKPNLEVEQKFREQYRNTYLLNILEQIRKIAEKQNLDEIIELHANLDQKVNEAFNEFQAIEEAIRAEEEAMSDIRKKFEQHERRRTLFMNAHSTELENLSARIEDEKNLNCQLEKQLTALIDFNCSRMSEDEINHLMGLRNASHSRKDRDLEKLLEKAKQDKVIDSHLVSPRMMHDIYTKQRSLQ